MSDKLHRLVELLFCRRFTTDALALAPYDLTLYLTRALVHMELNYPDLAAGDDYRALLLTDEVRNESFEYHARALATLESYNTGDGGSLQVVLRKESRVHATMSSGKVFQKPGDCHECAFRFSLCCYQVLAVSLLRCGCLRTAIDFCDKGLASMPTDKELREVRELLETVARGRLHIPPHEPLTLDMLPDRGLVRRDGVDTQQPAPGRAGHQ